MKFKLLGFLLFIGGGLFSQNQTNAQSLSIFNDGWKLYSIDSCGNKKDFPSDFKPAIRFFNFKEKGTKLDKWDKYYKKRGYEGKVKIVSNKGTSNYWCNIKGYYKMSNDSLTLFWDDNFKGQENFDSFNSTISYWFFVAMNATGKINNNSNEIVFNMTKPINKKKPICIKLIIRK